MRLIGFSLRRNCHEVTDEVKYPNLILPAAVGTPPYKLAHGAITAKFIYTNRKNDGSALFAAQLAPNANYYLYFALFCAIIIYILSV